jgi:large subunit ribosomal protein L14
MIQSGTYLNVIDNSGAKIVYCIKLINSGYRQRYGYVGSVILVSIKSIKYSKNIKVKKGEMCKALIVRTTQHNFNVASNYRKFLKNDAILLNKKNKLMGTRIFGTLPKTIKSTKYSKMLFLCQGYSF